MDSQERKQHKKERVLEKMLRYKTKSPETIRKRTLEYMEVYGSNLWVIGFVERYQSHLKNEEQW